MRREVRPRQEHDSGQPPSGADNSIAPPLRVQRSGSSSPTFSTVRQGSSSSVGHAAVTVGLVAWWVAPISLAAAFALGAVVAPPDAVAASAIARRVGMPRRIVSILEGGYDLEGLSKSVAAHVTALMRG